MKCLLCDSKTKVTNSRVRSYGVWRRRSCINAHIFTTTEQADLSGLSVDKQSSTQESFNSHKLGLSLSNCGLSGNEVVELQRTIIHQVLKHIDDETPVIKSALIAEITHNTLEAYDSRYADRYRSYSQQLVD